MPHITRHPPGTPCWFDLSTPDPEGARAFYSAVLGWAWGPVGGPETGSHTTALKDGRKVAGVGKVQNEQQPSAWGVFFAIDDVSETARKVTERGGQIVAGPMDVMGEGHLLFFSDPTGAHCGVWQPGRHIGAEVCNEHGAMCWCEVNTRDMETARDFYVALFGLRPQKLESDRVAYTTLHHGEAAVCGVLQMDAQWEGIPPHWMGYFQVDDIAATAERAEKAGGKVVVQPFPSPHGQIAVISDPFGAHFSLLQPAAG